MPQTRRATAQDAALITAHRRAMFAEMGGTEESVLDQMSHSFEPWVAQRLASGQYLGWIIEHNGHPIAGAGMQLVDAPPHPLDPVQDIRGHVINVYVDREHRRGGLARQLVELCLNEAARRGLRVVTLHPSEAGRPLYETLGFRTTNEMRRVTES